ncbi:MAG: phosphatase PAP2 family protein [Rubrimonas sp.]|uniref:phosphatase PAP2 family protein n=1 Tax=Rubrimonas sp. TaxID=2036015 RepID=UPI002FDD2A22
MRGDATSFGATDVDARALALAVLGSAWLFAFTFLDPLVLAYFRAADPELVGFWRWATGVGDSGWMMASCAAVGLAAHVAARGPRPVADAPPARPRRAARALRRRALFALGCVAGLGTLAAILKMTIGRARPKLAETLGAYHFEPLAFDYKLNSLPSGHAATLFALAAALALIAPRWRPVFYGVALWGAVSRTGAGAHYLSDVIAGGALGHYVTRALARAAAARDLPVAFADAPAEGRAALRAARVLAAAAARRATSWIKEAPHALHNAVVRRRRADA